MTTPKFLRSYPKFSDSKYPDGFEDEDALKLKLEAETAKPDRNKKQLWLDEDDEELPNFDLEYGRRKPREDDQQISDNPSFQDFFRTHLMNTIDREMKIADGEHVEEEESDDPDDVIVEDEIRYGITEKEVIDRVEELVTKCKCRDCRIERQDFEKALEAADDGEQSLLNEKDKKLFNALYYDRDREFFRKKLEQEQMKNIADEFKWLPDLNFDDNCDKCKVNIDDYKKKSDSDDENPWVNLARKYDELEFCASDED